MRRHGTHLWHLNCDRKFSKLKLLQHLGKPERSHLTNPLSIVGNLGAFVLVHLSTPSAIIFVHLFATTITEKLFVQVDELVKFAKLNEVSCATRQKPLSQQVSVSNVLLFKAVKKALCIAKV